MRAAWRGLTLRGRTLLIGAALVALASLALGQRDLLRVAALLAALPIVGVLLLARRDDRITVLRRLDPLQVPVGGTATVHLLLRNVGRRTSGPLLVTDALDRSIGVAPRVLVERLAPGTDVVTRYEVEARVRGRHRIGPMTLRLEDPFGLVQTVRTTETTHTLVVTPSVAPLARTPVMATTGGSGDGAAHRTAAAGHDDVGTREYRAGDELRRVHWRSTARTGSLMVRQEEQPWEAEALVVVDTRAGAHTRSRGAGPADPSTSSFEWAVHAGASIGAHLAQSERRVRVVAGQSDVTVTGGGIAPMLDALAVLRTDRDGALVPTSAHQASTPIVVAVLGALDAADLHAVSALRASAAGGVAIVLDTDSWTTGAPSASDDVLTAPLAAAGWRTAVARRDDPVAAVWARAVR